jgi:phosphonate transport system permease protein
MKRWLVMLLLPLGLSWAWSSAGLSGSTRIWSNRDRAVNYVFGQPVDESTRNARREEIARELRTEYQTNARKTLGEEYDRRGEVRPGLMAMMREAQSRAEAQINALPDGAFDREVDERLRKEGVAGRRGGFFPPELDPRRVFGDPSDGRAIAFPFDKVAAAGENVGGMVGRSLQWIAISLGGSGYTGKLVETICIAVWGTLLAVLIALPVSLLGAARSFEILSPGQSVTRKVARGTGRFCVRRTFDVSRGFNEVVLAMIFVAVLGLGPLPGVIALLVHTYGVLGKVFSEALETIDRGQVEGVQSTGAGPMQIITFAVLPQVWPYVVSQSLLRFESNVRGATILGVVGAGGIGQMLMDKFGAYEFAEVATMMILIILAVTAIDFVCTSLMRRLI